MDQRAGTTREVAVVETVCRAGPDREGHRRILDREYEQPQCRPRSNAARPVYVLSAWISAEQSPCGRIVSAGHSEGEAAQNFCNRETWLHGVRRSRLVLISSALASRTVTIEATCSGSRTMARFPIVSILIVLIAAPARAQNAQDFERLFVRALELQQAGDVLGAIDTYKAALAIIPDRADALSNLGAAYVRLGQYDDGIAQYEAALKSDPTNTAFRLNL